MFKKFDEIKDYEELLKVIETDIGEFNFNSRTELYLRRGKINTLNDLRRYDTETIKSINRIGTVTAQYIEQIMSKNGWSISPEDWEDRQSKIRELNNDFNERIQAKVKDGTLHISEMKLIGLEEDAVESLEKLGIQNLRQLMSKFTSTDELKDNRLLKKRGQYNKIIAFLEKIGIKFKTLEDVQENEITEDTTIDDLKKIWDLPQPLYYYLKRFNNREGINTVGELSKLDKAALDTIRLRCSKKEENREKVKHFINYMKARGFIVCDEMGDTTGNKIDEVETDIEDIDIP